MLPAEFGFIDLSSLPAELIGPIAKANSAERAVAAVAGRV
jgi:hypothetical protein